MKLLSDVAKSYLPAQSEGKIVHMIAVLGGWKKLDNPTMSTDLQCLICGNHGHYTPLIDPAKGMDRVWICMDGDCASNKTQKREACGYTLPKPDRAILWPKFCEINGIGDIHYDVKFEDIQQSQGKISYLLKFAEKPKGIILMQGKAGGGKTFASMAVCELYTRKSTSCMFLTQEQLSAKWIDTFKNERPSNLTDRVMNTSLLVIDDFGLKDPTPAFMQFFMDIINTRMQWTNRGTIITTNLKDEDFIKYCGEALTDRINTGQKFEFKDKSRRKETIL